MIFIAVWAKQSVSSYLMCTQGKASQVPLIMAHYAFITAVTTPDIKKEVAAT